MNIFDVLYTGKRRITEENVSAVLAWMIDPKGTHGWGSEFLRRLLDTWPEKEVFREWKRRLPTGPGYGSETAANVTVRLEYPVSLAGGENFRAIDVLLSLAHPDVGEMTLIIENKIRSSSVGEHQLLEEYQGLLEQLREGRREHQIALLYIVPTLSPRTSREFDELPADVPKHLLTWQGQSDSIETILSRILTDDREAVISPLSADVVTVAKSFLVHVRNGFARERPDVGRGGEKYFEDYVTGIDGLIDLGQERTDVFIGFTGGLEAFKSRLEEDPDNLSARPFKWSADNTSGNKQKRNWIPISDVLGLLRGDA